MTREERLEWRSMLARRKVDQAETIRTLLLHAGEDHMSMEDRAICIETLKELEEELGGIVS